ncbi:MAG: ferrichrome-iron receptor [Alphaproteobacteria bacterium MedPE-SWcel]|nr:MAG: ferrichrome-iron receptor [Alphaproteobacteria bacterium MedPE-SWcel]
MTALHRHFHRNLFNRLATSTALCSCLALSTLPALAQEGEIIVLDDIDVTFTENATGSVDQQSNPLTVTGGKVPLLLSEVPQSVSVLGREEIETFDATRVSEALRYTAGVTAEVFGDDNDYDWLRVRGFQADQTGIYLDNAQNLSFAFGSFFVDPYTLERIEVLRGPSSALYGGSNPGGIVNYVTKRPGGHVGEMSFSLNDAGRAAVAFDLGEDLAGDRAYRVTGRLEAGEHHDDINSGWRGTLSGGYKLTTDAGTELTFLTTLHKADEQHNGSTFLPYDGTVVPTTEFGFIDPDANFSDPDWDSYARDQATVSAIAEHEFANGFTLTGIGRLGYVSLEESYYYPYGYSGYALSPSDADGTLSLVAFEHDTTVRTAQADIRYFGRVNTGAVEHNLLLGLDARSYTLDETQASGFGSNTVVNPTAPGTPVTSIYQDAETKQKQLGIYAQNQIGWGAGWRATFNLRHDWVDTEQVGTSNFSRSDSETSYRAALAYEFAGGFTPYLSLSSFFNPLISSPSSGVTQPESGDQIELGFKWMPQGSNFSVSGALFQIDQENVVTGAFPSYNQLGEVRMRGLELEAAYDFGNGLRVKGAATTLDAEITADSDSSLIGLSPTLVPELELSLLAEYAFAGPRLTGLSIGGGLRHRGESFANDANTLSVPSYTVYDAYLQYALAADTDLRLSVTNIGDDRYVTGCQTAYVCSYGAGREFALTLTKTF